MYVVEQRGGVGPEASDRLDRLIGSERALTADQAILDAALAVVAMAGRAVLRENLLTVPHRATAVGQALAVGLDVDVPQLDFVRARGTSEIEGVSRKYEERGSYRTRKELLRREHCEPSHLRRCSRSAAHYSETERSSPSSQ